MDFFEKRQDATFCLNDEGDRYVLREIYLDNTYDVFIEPGMRILDIGANKGIFTVWCAMKGGFVTSYEPNPETYTYLVKNLALNGIPMSSCQPYQAGVWKESGSLKFYPNKWNSGGSTFYPRVTNHHTTEPILVPVVTLDSCLRNQEWDIVKIDTEGAEYEIILASEKLNQIRRLEIECHYWNQQGGNLNIPDGDQANTSAGLFDQMIEKLSRYFNGTKVLDQRQHEAGLMLHLTRKP